MIYINFLVYNVQKLLLSISYFICKMLVKKENKTMVGVDEVASNIKYLAMIIDNCITVSLKKNKYYNYKYNFSIYNKNAYLYVMLRKIYGPILLGYLLTKCRVFIYISGNGFLSSLPDGREYEFKFIKSIGKKIICYFVGSEVRSPILLNNYAKENDIEVITKYIFDDIIDIDNKVKKISASADKYADIVFNFPIDQMSYIKKNVYAPIYILPNNKFQKNDKKFKNMDTVVIVHAPTSPIIKGTQLVRAAIKRAKLNGYKLNYIELNNASNDKVLCELHNAHIVLNEFYAFVPGLFGIEAMASQCALITSADPHIEKFLPSSADNAWLTTKYWQIYENIEYLLLNKNKIIEYAHNGYEWVSSNCKQDVAKVHIEKIFIENNIFLNN